MKTERLMRQMLKVRPQTWGRMTWTSQFLRVIPNNADWDRTVAEFLITVCVADRNTA